MTRLFGITTCDTVKKARRWLEAQAIPYEFCDLRGGELTANRIEHWLQALGASVLVNTRSTTWRQLPPQTQAATASTTPVATLLANPTLLKRPVLEHEGGVYAGFSEAAYTHIFHSHIR